MLLTKVASLILSTVSITSVLSCMCMQINDITPATSEHYVLHPIIYNCHLCCACHCVALLLFVLSYVLIVCTVPLPPGVNPIAIDKYIYLYLSNYTLLTADSLL